ncbi:hypothetical protein [Sinisalibacter aestuarii]|uniref:Uncharacterized protein n=1 Tax=Sinisalibacter aestuarii TaxID=2949426 RepID=A0ABQ5LQN1_9RHOB|nr:hypothetical protein [Sinisalibacter aestuarii]GKY87263.1 hypothetical protein STA1M1_11320 [Sinisalibacter aestuarii]
MSEANFQDFQRRLREIDQRHKRLSVGYVRLVERDGLLVPVDAKPMRRRFNPRGVAIILAMFLVFKGFLLFYLGPGTYASRVGALEEGTVFERMGAWIMQADPVTHWIATQITMMF